MPRVVRLFSVGFWIVYFLIEWYGVLWTVVGLRLRGPATSAVGSGAAAQPVPFPAVCASPSVLMYK